MKIYNVTKYDPNTRGKVDEWTAISDINSSFEGKVLTLEEYLRVENNYVEAIKLIMDFLGIKTLEISYLEKRKYFYYPSSKAAFNSLYPIKMRDLHKKVRKGKILTGSQIPYMVKLMLREALYAELEHKVNFIDNQYDFKVFIGFDYMMGVHSNRDLSALQSQLLDLGIYLEN